LGKEKENPQGISGPYEWMETIFRGRYRKDKKVIRERIEGAECPSVGKHLTDGCGLFDTGKTIGCQNSVN
jgi:hypothetical protein